MDKETAPEAKDVPPIPMNAIDPDWQVNQDRYMRFDTRRLAVTTATELAKMRSATEDPETVRERFKADCEMVYTYLITDVPPVAN